MCGDTVCSYTATLYQSGSRFFASLNAPPPLFSLVPFRLRNSAQARFWCPHPPFWSGRASETATTTALKRKSTSTAEDEFRWHHPSFAMPTLNRKKGFLASRIRDHDRYYSGKQSYPSPQPFPNPHGGAPSLARKGCCPNLRRQQIPPP